MEKANLRVLTLVSARKLLVDRILDLRDVGNGQLVGNLLEGTAGIERPGEQAVLASRALRVAYTSTGSSTGSLGVSATSTTNGTTSGESVVTIAIAALTLTVVAAVGSLERLVGQPLIHLGAISQETEEPAWLEHNVSVRCCGHQIGVRLACVCGVRQLWSQATNLSAFCQ